MARAKVAALALVVAACGGATTTTRLSPSAGGEVHAVGGGSVVVLVRPHATRVRAQLWIDAGAIDAASESGAPEVASLAAWIAEARGGDGVRARVVPDGTMLECISGSVAEAIAPLARAIATREPTEAEVMTARATLRERRRGRAPDGLAALEAQAVGALFGPADPLGLEPEGPAPEPDAERAAIRAFLDAHYGPDRARWVIVGAIEPRDVPDVVRAAVVDLPLASHEAPARRVHADAGPTLVVDDAGLAVAVLDPRSSGLGGARGLAGSDLSRRAAYPTPCGLLAVASTSAAPDAASLRALAFALTAGPGTEQPPSHDDDSDAEREGLAFVGRRERCAERPTAPLRAVRLAVPERGERVAAELEAALAADRTGTVQHLDVDGHTTALVVVFAGGASEDAERTHGRATIVGRALAERCGVDVTVEPERVVVVRRFADAGLDALARTLRCVAVDPVPVAFFEDARARALGALDAGATFLQYAAQAIAPGTPGSVAPAGSPAGLAGADALAETLASLRTDARMSVAIVSPEPPDDALGRALGTLSPGAAPSDGSPVPGPTESFVAAVDAELVEVIVTLRIDRAADAAPARHAAVARALAEEIEASPLAVNRLASGSARTFDWVAIGVTGPDEAIDALDRHLAGAVTRAEARIDAVPTIGRPSTPEDLARASVVPEPIAPSVATTHALLRAAPRRVVVRPSTPAVRRR